jgi:hypothetical protein
VAGDPVNGFTISFKSDGARDLIQERQQDAQFVDVTNLGKFQITFGADTTTKLGASSTAAEVQTALNALASVQSAGGVTVSGGANGVYDIVFNTFGPEPLISATETTPLTVAQHSAGTPGKAVVTYDHHYYFDDVAYQAANLVGAIVDFNELGADHFKFLDTAGGAGGTGDGVFVPGDTPIDGILMAKNFSQRTSNFTPQARYVLNSDVSSGKDGVYKPVSVPFFDFDNQI